MAVSATQKLKQFYTQFSGDDQVLILINADPDAISCAMAVKRLLWRKVAGVTISNINIIKRPDNIAMVRLMGIDLVHVNRIKADQFTRFVMVDSQPTHNEKFQCFNFNVIIDHHPDMQCEVNFKDIRPDYGATASILTEYLKAAKIKPSAKLASGLFLGIKSDTNNFARQTLIEDVRAFQFLFRYANMQLIRRIEQADLTTDFLEYFEIALRTRRFRKKKMYVHLGPVKNPDICVIIADFFMRLNTTNWSIAAGCYRNTLVIIFRNDGIRKNAGNVATQSFGTIGTAGGHKSMARAEIGLDKIKEILPDTHNDTILKWIIRSVERKTDQKKTVKKNDPTDT